MKNLFQFSVVLLLFVCVFACTTKEDEFDRAPAPAQVLNPAWIATNGGAVISYTLPNDKNLLFVKAVYINSLGNKVFRSSSQYVSQLDIDGFNDLNPHEVQLVSVGHNGKESAPVTITVVPDSSYIELIRNNMTVQKAVGGINIKWHNPSKKMVYAYINYDSEKDTVRLVERILASDVENYDMTIRGLDTIPYQVNIVVEDLSGNKTIMTDKGMYIPDPEQKIDKRVWTVITNLSCNGDLYEGKLVYFFDDVIDVIELGGKLTEDPNGNNSYFIINKSQNSDPIQWINGSSELDKPLLIVIDMHKYAALSRIKYWQRAFHYDSGNPSSTVNSTYHYYQEDNMRSFLFMGLTEDEMAGMNKKKLAAKLWTDHWVNCDVGDPHDTDGNIPQSKYKEAVEGHEFVLPNFSKPFRYIVIGITKSFGSETQICGSEITLWGQDNVEYNTGEPEE
ncbi:MAG: DUF4959 domain-containing protein [Dysgonamonadaceae bacterium]|nr:DUF4959 domain-containing protein [Dysgonamonadaceae bacterium]